MCAGLCARVDPEKAPKPRFAAESRKSYPLAILAGPFWCLPSPAASVIGGYARDAAALALVGLKRKASDARIH